MRSILSCFFALVVSVSANSAYADIIARVQGPGGTINAGDLATFSVYISSDAGAIDINLFQMNAIAGAGDGSDGSFTVGSQLLYLLGGGDDAFDVSVPGTAFSVNQGATTSLNAEVEYARLVLDTTGVASGTYQLSLTDLQGVFLTVPVQNSVSYNVVLQDGGAFYTISAVPEPASAAAIVAASGIGYFIRKRRNRVACA